MNSNCLGYGLNERSRFSRLLRACSSRRRSNWSLRLLMGCISFRNEGELIRLSLCVARFGVSTALVDHRLFVHGQRFGPHALACAAKLVVAGQSLTPLL